MTSIDFNRHQKNTVCCFSIKLDSSAIVCAISGTNLAGTDHIRTSAKEDAILTLEKFEPQTRWA
jgi:hypothetical protein